MINEYISLEKSIGCYEVDTYKRINLELSSMALQLKRYIINLDKNVSIFSYGAAPTSIVNSLLLGYEQHLSAYIDDNKTRQNTLSPNNFIPVLEPIKLKEFKKPFVIIGAWRFSDMIIKKIKKINPNALICIPSLREGIKIINVESE